MSNQPDQVLRCTRCFGRDVRRSQHRGLLDNIMKMLQRSPYRCRGCHKRFYVYIPKEKDEIEEVEPEEAASETNAETAHNPDGR